MAKKIPHGREPGGREISFKKSICCESRQVYTPGEVSSISLA
nr:MAG TPA: hypothetical protein [Caudoviricetes sp.]DAV81430.1 MAG TPA: hypothetical protein [Caudoviricetes sp.]